MSEVYKLVVKESLFARKYVAGDILIMDTSVSSAASKL